MNTNNCSVGETVYITGHKNPDSDSICSAIAYAELKRQLGVNAVPARTGKVNRETAFVLEHFGLEPPAYLATVKTQVCDLNMDKIAPASPDVSLKEAWQALKVSGMEVLPIQNGNHEFIGIVSISDIANAYMNMQDSNALADSNTPLKNVVNALDAHIVCGNAESFSGFGRAAVAAMSPGGMTDYIEKGSVVFVGDLKGNQLKAIESGAGCVIVTCGSEIEADVIKAAQARGCVMLVTGYDTFTAARLLYQSIPVSYTMTSNGLVLFKDDDFVDAAREKMLQTRFRSYPVVDAEKHFCGFISRYHLLNQRKKRVILVDHSETSQSVNGIEQAEIVEVIDHHRIGDIQTGSPIFYRNEPTGSTAAIIANLYSEHGIKPRPEIAGILCAAIISDTIKFKSPTSTHVDFITAQRLAKLANIDIDDFSRRMFDAGSSIKNMTVAEIVLNDFKEYAIGKHKIGVGQVNTTELRSIKKIRQLVLGHLNGLAANDGYDILMVLFTDIMEESTEVLFVESHKGLVARAFSPLKDENSFIMTGVVSRKKQIVPRLIAELS